jgi:hypothetical protein
MMHRGHESGAFAHSIHSQPTFYFLSISPLSREPGRDIIIPSLLIEYEGFFCSFSLFWWNTKGFRPDEVFDKPEGPPCGDTGTADPL